MIKTCSCCLKAPLSKINGVVVCRPCDGLEEWPNLRKKR